MLTELELKDRLYTVRQQKRVLENRLEKYTFRCQIIANSRQEAHRQIRGGIVPTLFYAGVIAGVIDNGPGIPEDALPHIFRRTYTVSHSRTPGSATGSGLGLSIAKAIVERLEGSICCTSEPGEGCCFLIQLPCI